MNVTLPQIYIKIFLNKNILYEQTHSIYLKCTLILIFLFTFFYFHSLYFSSFLLPNGPKVLTGEGKLKLKWMYLFTLSKSSLILSLQSTPYLIFCSWADSLLSPTPQPIFLPFSSLLSKPRISTFDSSLPLFFNHY